MQRNPKVYITATYVDQSILWSTTWRFIWRGSIKKKNEMHYPSKRINIKFFLLNFTVIPLFCLLCRDLIKCRMCDALFFNKKAYENHNLFHKSDDVYIENEQQRYYFIFIWDPILWLEISLHLLNSRQTLVTRVDQDFDIRRVQTQAEKFLPRVSTLNRSRKRKAQTSKQKSSSVRWVLII